MARPLRIEFPGALYHITSRGDRREAIYEDDGDRTRFLDVLGQVALDLNWICHAYCLMTNHYHLVIETPEGNLSRGMRQINGVFTQYSNRRHARTGHLFQGRFKAILVDGDSYLLELARYVALNPVRARIVSQPGEWPWSSYVAMMGIAASPPWLATDGLLAAFAKRLATARQRYRAFVFDGMHAESIWTDLKAGAYLGDDDFIARSLKHANGQDDVNIPKTQRRAPPPPLDKIARTHATRDEAIVACHASGGYSYTQIADYFGLHFTTVGRIVRASKSSGITG